MRSRNMNLYSTLAIVFSWILCLEGTNGAEGKKRAVIMDYLGAQGVPIDVNEVPVHDNVDFYFLLSFGIDSDRDGIPQNGTFNPFWVETLTPESVLKVKSVHKNVKVLMSLGGWSVYTNAEKEKILFWYDPEDKVLWLKNAVTSITKIVQEYHLDGIDIDYESFFSLVGELITTLKQKSTISIATIAPFTETNSYYAELFTKFSSVIDLVAYQFYSEISTKPAEIAARYEVVAKTYTFEKLIPGYQVNGIGLQGKKFTDALNLIKKRGHELNGIMIYSADEGLKNGFAFEKQFQEMF
ncbi:hypothetical protein Mapa_006448 [Marchantia paleacea]|nr:hypothetical protein Mapa_006448 [Marchantia paleacea]